MATSYPPVPETKRLKVESPRPLPIDARRLYTDRWMFHGPSFQGVTELRSIGDNGITGTLEALPAAGGLLDNAGQLFGYWVMMRVERDRLAFPFRVERMAFYGPMPGAGTRVGCDVEVLELTELLVRADMELMIDGRTWLRIDGWEDRRFDTDPRLWEVFLHPERNLLAVPRADGAVVFSDAYRAAPTREQLQRRFLGARERAEYEAQPPRAQRAWLAGRIAAKDAVRHLLWERGAGPIFPVEIEIQGDHARHQDRVIALEIAVEGDVTVARGRLPA
jgi:hypothetical protein